MFIQTVFNRNTNISFKNKIRMMSHFFSKNDILHIKGYKIIQLLLRTLRSVGSVKSSMYQINTSVYINVDIICYS